MYPFLQETISRKQIAASDNQLIIRSRDVVQNSRRILGQPCPSVFLGRRNLVEPPLLEYD
jgi:hypothetical protein